MKKSNILITILFILCCMNVATAAEYPYWIGGTDTVYVPVDVAGNSKQTIYIIKTAGYTPNANNVFEYYENFDSYTAGSSITSVAGWSLDSGWLIIIVVFVAFGFILGEGLGKQWVVIFGLIGLFAGLYMKIAPDGQVLLAIFAVLLAIAAYRKYKER